MALPSVSASQIKTFTQCRRKWAYEKLVKVPTEKAPHLELGEQVHGEVEDYLLENKPPNFPSVLVALDDPKFPKAQQRGQMVEFPANYNLGISLAGVPVRGRIDLHYFDEDTGRATIWDWKTSKNFNYALTPDELAEDIQLNIYGKFAIEKYGATELEYYHGYLKTPDPKKPPEDFIPDFRPVSSGLLLPEDVERVYNGLGSPVSDMQNCAAGFANSGSVEEIAGLQDTGKCDRLYGGCPYRNICTVYNASPFGRKSEDKQGEVKMSLKDKLKARKTSAVVVETETIQSIVPPDAPVPAADLIIPETSQMGGSALALLNATKIAFSGPAHVTVLRVGEGYTIHIDPE